MAALKDKLCSCRALDAVNVYGVGKLIGNGAVAFAGDERVALFEIDYVRY